MKVFVFGAGASFGSQDFNTDDFHPPLTDNLFKTPYMTDYANLLGINEAELKQIQDNLNSSGKSFEEYFTDHWVSIDQLKNPLTKKARKRYFAKITFYLWMMLVKASQKYQWEINAYRTLLNKLYDKDEEFRFINFNYDTLLDRAIIDVFKESFNSLTDYVEFGYIKPHGSVNWILGKRRDDPGMPSSSYVNARQSIEFAVSNMLRENLPVENLQIYSATSDRLAVSQHNDDLIRTHKYFYPFMFMPLTAKLYEYADEYLQRMLAEGSRFISDADEAVLVGYQAKDELIKKLLSNSAGNLKISVVSNSARQDIVDELIKLSPLFKAGDVFEGGFKKYAEDY